MISGKNCSVNWRKKSWRRTELRNPRNMRTTDVVSRWIGEVSKETYQPRKRCEDFWARIFAWFKVYSLKRSRSMQAGKREEEGIKQQQRMNTMTDMTRKIK